MCRLVGIVSSELSEFGIVLKEAPRSLAKLSREHPDGWGIAVHDAERHGERCEESGPSLVHAPRAARAHEHRGWSLHKGTELADDDSRFHEIAGGSRGHVLIAHIRQKTVGATRIENTHPFTREGWTFAHNGTVKDVATLRAGASKARLSEIQGDTDSELLFAYLLTRLDEAGLTKLDGDHARDTAHRRLLEVTAVLRDKAIGAFNFLLSDGVSSFAHRFGRTLFLLERRPTDPVREARSVGHGASLVTRWTPRRHAIFVASERITDEPWTEVPEGALLRIERLPVPRFVSVDVPTRAAS